MQSNIFAGDGLYPDFDFGVDFPKFAEYMKQFDYFSMLKGRIEVIVADFKKRGNGLDSDKLLFFLLLNYIQFFILFLLLFVVSFVHC